MIEMSVTEFARNLRAAFDRVEHHGVEIVLIRNHHRIARIIPGSARQTAVEAMGDLYRTMTDEVGATWLDDSRVAGTLADETRDPWDS